MSTLLDVIQKIRERPGIILGRPSATTLNAFLIGFAYARKESDTGDYDFLASFNQWVHDRYKVTSTQGWAKIIEFYSLTEGDERALFWRRSAQKKVS
jgi:hypothetical protein